MFIEFEADSKTHPERKLHKKKTKTILEKKTKKRGFIISDIKIC